MSLITKEVLLSHLSRAEMASEVTLPIDFFRDLLYQAMPREWVGLTPEEVKEISLANRPYVVDMVVALEARLKEKNT